MGDVRRTGALEGTTMAVRRRATGDGGAAAVEFALLLPFLALLVCGVIDLGRWFSAWNETKNAAREGAQYAQVYPNQQRPVSGTQCASPNNVEDRVKQELGSSAASSFMVAIQRPIATCNPSDSSRIVAGESITVTVSRQVPLITPIIRNLVGSVDIQASVRTKVQG